MPTKSEKKNIQRYNNRMIQENVDSRTQNAQTWRIPVAKTSTDQGVARRRRRRKQAQTIRIHTRAHNQRRVHAQRLDTATPRQNAAAFVHRHNTDIPRNGPTRATSEDTCNNEHKIKSNQIKSNQI